MNEVLEIFFKKEFSRSKKDFEKKFFDRRKYLKKMLQSSSAESLDQGLKEYMKKYSKGPVMKAFKYDDMSFFYLFIMDLMVFSYKKGFFFSDKNTIFRDKVLVFLRGFY